MITFTAISNCFHSFKANTDKTVEMVRKSYDLPMPEVATDLMVDFFLNLSLGTFFHHR